MDLGFGQRNQQVGDAAAQVLAAASQAQERAVEEEMAQYDALLQDDEALEQLRARRLQQMKQQKEQRSQWLQAGHGTYTELGAGQGGARDVGKEFFEATKQSERVVVHFFRPSSAKICDVLHSHLQKLAPKHLETRFCKVDVSTAEDGGASSGVGFLVQRLGISVMPSLVMVQNRKAVHVMAGFDEVGGTENFKTAQLAQVLARHGMLTLRDDEDSQDED